jgi:long-subunit acyl-CoA synthetase (AMP-forming)
MRHYTDDLAVFNPTAVAVVPRLLQLLAARGALGGKLRLVLVGAADCPDALLNAVRERGIRASLGYGLTETSSGIALSTGDDFHAMTICPEDTVTIGADGEILVSAPTCLMRGYYRDAGKTATAIRDGVLHTGDRGLLDKEGRLHVMGRFKDVLVLPSGTKVFLPEYEGAVAKALGERDVAVLLHENMVTLVCGRLSRERTDRELFEGIEPAMVAYPFSSRVGRILRFGRALPRTAAGNVEKWKIQEELQHGDC